MKWIVLIAALASVVGGISGPAHAARCSQVPAAEVARGADAVFYGEVLKDGRRVRVVEAFRGVRRGQVVQMRVPQSEGGERFYFAVRRVGPNRYFQEARTGTGSVACRSRNLERQIEVLRRMQRRANTSKRR